MAAVGFVSDKSDPFFIPESHTDDVLRIDAFGNTDIPGLWVFRVDGKAILTPLSCKKLTGRAGTISQLTDFGVIIRARIHNR